MHSRRGSISTHTNVQQPPILFHTSPAAASSSEQVAAPRPRRNSVSFLTPQSIIESKQEDVKEDVKEDVNKNKQGIKSLTHSYENLLQKVASVEARKECECSKFESIYRAEFRKEIDVLKREVKYLSDELKNLIES